MSFWSQMTDHIIQKLIIHLFQNHPDFLLRSYMIRCIGSSAWHVQSFFSCKHTLKTAPSCHSLSDQIYVTKWQTTFHIPRREHAFYFRVTGFPANVNLPFSHPRKVNFWHFERRSRSLRVETCPQGSVGLLTSVFFALFKPLHRFLSGNMRKCPI